MPIVAKQRIPEFAKVVAAAFDTAELERLCLEATGKELFAEFASEKDIRVDIVADLLGKLQDFGEADEKQLLTAIFAARPRNVQLATLIKSVYPDVEIGIAIIKPTEIVNTGLDQLITLLGVKDGKSVIEKSRMPIEKVARNVSYMSVYKNLHDCLHQFQVKPYFELRDATDKSDIDTTQRSILLRYRTDVELMLLKARDHIADLPPDETEALREENWINDMEKWSGAYNAAFDAKNSNAAGDALFEINQILATVPVRLNEEIMMKAKTLPIEELSGIIEAISTAIGANEVKIIRAQESMRKLGPSITTRVEQHKMWQDTDRIISILDTLSEHQGNDLVAAFRLYWPKVKEKIKALMDKEAGAEWATRCAQYTMNLDDEVAKEKFGPELQVAYDELRESTRAQFNAVDLHLKLDCSALSRMSAPLLRLLETTVNG